MRVMSPVRSLTQHARVVICTAFALAVGMSAPHGLRLAMALEGPPSARTLCYEADLVSGEQRQRLLRRGLELAEAAVAADPDDASAHFAVFCNLGKQLQSHSAGPREIREVGRLKNEI